MKCDCGLNAFFYEKTEDYKKWNIYKCGLLPKETKKKVKCNFYIEQFVGNITVRKYGNEDESQREENTVLKCDDIKQYRLDLNKFIYLCEISIEKPEKFRANYIANINYLLNKLNFRLFFEEKESLESLKNRINKQGVPKKYPNIFPINLLKYPDDLKPTCPVNKKINKKVLSKNKRVIKIDDDFKECEYRKTKDEDDVEKEGLQDSDSNSDSDSDSDKANNTFDVDEYDSSEEYDNYEDGGAFSD